MASLNPLQGVLGHRKAAHLLRRTTFRFTKPKVDQLSVLTIDQALDNLLQTYPLKQAQPLYTDFQNNPPLATNYAWINPPGTALPSGVQDFMTRRFVVAWWLDEAQNDPGISHKMAFFFHQFNITTLNTSSTNSFFDYLALMRWGGLGNFKKLATKIVMDNVMLRYLDNTTNNKNNPNENFAREFLELFTIGKGPQVAPGDYTNYTEDDIVQAARVFTGFKTRIQRDQIDPETNLPRGTVQFAQHDTGAKTFSPRFQNTTIAGATNAAGMLTELDAFVTMVFNQPETAKNLCRRLYHYFVSPNITAEIENDIIGPLSQVLRNNNFEMKPTLRALLSSQHFFDADDSDNKDEILGALIKSPLELALQSITFFGMPIPDPLTQQQQFYRTFYGAAVQDRMMSPQNLPLFQAADVAGYPAYYQEPDFSRQWFTSLTIVGRYKMPEMLLSGRQVLGANPNGQIGSRINSPVWVRDSGVVSNPADPAVLVSDILKYLLPEEVDADRFNYFLNKVFLDGLPAQDWTYEWEAYINTNVDTEVRLALDRFLRLVLSSPEYQTF